jgi:hypothetical protein
MREVRLSPRPSGGRWACLREMCGRDEVLAVGDDELVAVELLDRLLVERPGTSVLPGAAASLAISERDRLLGAVYRHHFGDDVEGTQRCHTCREPFELRFSLAGLLASLEERGEADDEGVFRLPDGRRFRLPTTLDRRRTIGLPAERAARQLLAGCLLDGEPQGEADAEIIQAAMEAAGPMLDLDLDASCPVCGADQEVRFDVVRHLVGVLAAERRWLTREVHCLARAYGWSHTEILALPRSERRSYVRLVSPATSTEGWS